MRRTDEKLFLGMDFSIVCLREDRRVWRLDEPESDIDGTILENFFSFPGEVCNRAAIATLPSPFLTNLSVCVRQRTDTGDLRRHSSNYAELRAELGK
jgi:hypothetical protein